MIKDLIGFRQSVIILIIGIVIGVLLLGRQSISIPVISHDDGISYLTAMGNESAYSNQLPHNKWVDAKEIKAFWTQTDFFKFEQIRYDLSHGDLHPPLYFWILHIWSNFQSVNAHTGPQLNIVFYSMTAILIFLICLSLKCRPYIATSMSILWLLNGSIVSVALETRQYGLLSLVSSLYLLSLLLFLQKRTNKSLAFVSLSAMLGMLTHYHFALLIVVSIVYISMYFFIMKKEKIVLFKFIIAFIIAGIFFILFHPDFYLC